MPVPTANTISAIAKRCHSTPYQVGYVVNSRGIQPVAWAGHARIFSDSDVDYIASELVRIAGNRGSF